VTDRDIADHSLKMFHNGKLKSGELSVCRASVCTFEKMYDQVVGTDRTSPKMDYKGYMWALAGEVRGILAKRNNARDKTPHLTPKKVGAFCVVDDGEPDYPAHACLGYAHPSGDFWSLHETVAARGDLLIAFQTRGMTRDVATPPFQALPAPAIDPGSEKL
jgi:hypothetical protein